jgi:hypothetical protein
MSDVFNTFNAEVEKRHNEMIRDLESISVEGLKSEGLQLTIGGKTYKFTDLEVVENEGLEDKLRKEFKEKLNTQQQRIRDKINQKINQLLIMHQQKQQEMDRKEQQMKRKYAESALMPEINSTHFSKGLSVTKGSSNDELIWIYSGTYNPRFISMMSETYGSRNRVKKRIPTRLVDRLKRPVFIFIHTKKGTITSVLTKSLSNGSFISFPHYHQTGTNDCWGNWKYNSRWEKPDDILRVAKDAEAVLETINYSSIASRGPSGMPRIQTIINAVESLPDVSKERKVQDGGNISENDDVWSAL